VTTGIEHRVKVVLPDAVETDGLIKLGLSVLVVLEADGLAGPEFGGIALRRNLSPRHRWTFEEGRRRPPRTHT
jgi:hypothetical protein